MRYAAYEPSTSGWTVVNHRRREARRRIWRVALGGATLLAVGAMAGLFFFARQATAIELAR